MIKINLLPPELRKRSASFEPLQLLGIAEALLIILLLLFGAYVQWVKIPAAQKILDEKQQERDQKQAKAQEVQDKLAEISEHQATVEELRSLLSRKVYWAHTLDDFCTLLASNFPENSQVRCTDFSIAPSQGSDRHAAGDRLEYSVNCHLQLVGDLNVSRGEYIKGMFRTIESSAFWRTHGFAGRPEDTYIGDQPTEDKVIGKVIIPFTLIFQRIHPLPKAAPKEGG